MSTILSTSSLMSAENAKSGFVEKKSNSLYNKVFPCAAEPYVKRFIVMSGAYLYRFTDSDSLKPKGLPIPIESITVEKVDDFSFCLRGIRKSYIFRAFSMEECRGWIMAIGDRKYMAIKESMGHAEVSSKVVSTNKAAGQLYEEAMRREGMNQSMNPLMHVN
jgi:hypothetical protein